MNWTDFDMALVMVNHSESQSRLSNPLFIKSDALEAYPFLFLSDKPVVVRKFQELLEHTWPKDFDNKFVIKQGTYNRLLCR